MKPEKDFNIEQNKISQEELFKVPEGYFSELEKSILSKTVEAEEQSPIKEEQTKVISIFGNRKYWMVAASLVIGLGVGLWMKSSIGTGEHQDYLSEVSTEEIRDYLATNYDDNEVYDYIEYYDIPVNSANQGFDVEDIDEEMILDELDEYDIEIDLDDLEF